MNDQKKRLVFYSVLILVCFTAAYFLLSIKTTQLETVIPVPEPPKQDSLIATTLLTDILDLENSGDGFVSSEKAASGKKSCKLSPDFEFGVNNMKTTKDIPGYQDLKKISIAFRASFDKSDPNAVYVIAIDNKEGKNVFWDSRPIAYSAEPGFTEQSLNFTIPPEFINPEHKINLYPWNRDKKTFYVDDITIEYVGMVAYKETVPADAEILNAFYDFESPAGIAGEENIKESTAHSGKKAVSLLGGTEFGPAVNKKISEFGSPMPKQVAASVWVYPLTDNVNIVLTGSVVNTKNETVFWEGEGSENKSFPKFKWTKINVFFKLPLEKIAPDDVLGVGIWNRGKTDVIIDDIEIVYGGGPERRGEVSKVDPTSIYEKRFVPQKNKPPFRTLWMEKQEIKNSNSVSITGAEKTNISDNFYPGDEYIVGDFFQDNNKLDEILHIGSAYKGLYSYSASDKKFNKLWSSPLVEDSLWNSRNNYYGGDFNNDGKTDVLITGKETKDWGIVQFNGKNWTIVSQGKNPKKEWLSRKKENVFPGNYADKRQTALVLNNDWRFDLKLLENDLILGNVDFKGYPADQNPKYYEFVKLIAGNFLSADQTALMVVMCNCSDKEFTGKQCEKIEDLSFLPNRVQVYTMQKESGSQIAQISADQRR